MDKASENFLGNICYALGCGVCLSTCQADRSLLAERYIALWGMRKGLLYIYIYKAMNRVYNAAQIWNKHYHRFMVDEGFLRSPRDDCIYVHPTSTVTCSLYVDDILAASDRDKRSQLMKFIRQVQQCFYWVSLRNSWGWK